MKSKSHFWQRYWLSFTHWVRDNKLLSLMILLAFLWAVIGSAALFPYFSVNNDEAVYVLEAQTLLEGRLTLPITTADEFTLPRFVYPLGDKNVFMYTHIFPAFLAAGEGVFGSMRVSLGLIAALSIGGFYALIFELYQDRAAALAAAGILLISPLFLLHSATYLPYTFLLMMATIFWYLAAYGLRKSAQWALVVAGVCAGLTFWARPLNGVIIVLPVVVACLFLPWKDLKTFWKFTSKLLAGFLPILGLILIYNNYLTGNPLQFPQMAFDRYTIPDLGRNLFTPGTIPLAENTPDLSQDAQNLISWFRITLSSLKGWTFGSWLAWLPLLYLLFTQHMNRKTILLISFIWFHPLMFYLFGFMDMTPQLLNEFGPIYSIPLLVPLLALVALGTVTLYRKWKYAAGALILGMVVLNGISLAPILSFHQQETRFYREIYQPLVDEEIQDGLVFIPIIFEETLLHPFGYLMNSPLIDGEVIYALDRGAENIKFINLHPDRDLYQFSLIENHPLDQQAGSNPYYARSFLTEMELVSGETYGEDLVIINPTSKQYVSVILRKGDQVAEYLLDDHSIGGKTYHITWNLVDGSLGIENDYLEISSYIQDPADISYFSVAVGFASSSAGTDLEIYQYRYDFQESESGELVIILPPEAYYQNHSGFLRLETISQIMDRTSIE